MKAEFLVEAVSELRAAVRWHNLKEAGLGVRLKDDVAGVVSRIRQNPFAGPERKNGVRRVNCRIFPYYLAYVLKEDSVLILAVAHQRRRPYYWKERSQ